MKKYPRKKRQSARSIAFSSTPVPQKLLGDIRILIQSSREQTAQVVNVGLVMLCWSIGQRIWSDIMKEKRAEYGEEIVPTVSAQLVPEFGQGFGRRNLFRMIQFAQVFPDKQIVSTLSRQ